MKTLILFDLDGTLLDTLQDLTDSVNHTLTQFGCPQRTREEIRRFVGNGAAQLIRLSLPGRKDDPPLQEVLAAYKRYYAAHSRISTTPYEGIADVLEQLQRSYPVAIVSNKPDADVKALCAHYFPGIYALGERPDCPRKPAPDMLLRTVAELNADRCVYVGDSEVDIQTARNAGVPCLGVLWGFRDEAQLRQAGAQYLCRNPSELLNMIGQMEQKTKISESF